MQKNKILLIGGVVLVLALVGGGGYVVMNSGNAKPTPTPAIVEEVIPTLTPSEIGLTFTARPDKKAVKFEIAKAKDMKSIDYEVTYTATGDIPRGAIGTVEVSGNTVASKYIDLGTCSANKCKYDEVTSAVKLTLKITKSDGKTYSAETSLSL